MTGTGRFAYLAHQVSPQTWTASRPRSRPGTPDIAEQNKGKAKEQQAPLLAGLYTEDDPIRSHPNGSVAATVVGVVGADGKGLSGLEYGLNDKLSGHDGRAMYEVDTRGNKIPNANHTVEEPKPGVSVQLTLDTDLQFFAEKRIQQAVEQYHATVRHGDHDGREVRRDPGDGQLPVLRPEREVQVGRPEQPRAGAHLRARQRAEGGHDGRPRRRRADRPEHQAPGSGQHRGAAADDQGPLGPRPAQPDHRRRGREVVERRHDHGRAADADPAVREVPARLRLRRADRAELPRREQGPDEAGRRVARADPVERRVRSGPVGERGPDDRRV